MTQPDAARQVVDILTGTWRAQALYAAVALRLPDHIAAGRTTAVELAASAGVDPDALIRLMRLLVGIGVFSGDGRVGYSLTELSYLLRSGMPEAMRDMCLLYGQEFHRAWGEIVPAFVRGGSGFEAAFGRTIHDYLATEESAGPRFLRAMNAGSMFLDQVPARYDFTSSRIVVDVAGGSGMLLAAVLRSNPSVRGILVDRVHMAATAEEYLSAAVGPDRFEIRTDDMFESVPAGADAYLLSRVLQDWRDRDCVRILINCRRAMTTRSARLLIIDRVIREDGSALLPLLWDLHLLMIAGGRERTLPSYQSILGEAGLRLESTDELALETSLLVAAPA